METARDPVAAVMYRSHVIAFRASEVYIVREICAVWIVDETLPRVATMSEVRMPSTPLIGTENATTTKNIAVAPSVTATGAYDMKTSIFDWHDGNELASAIDVDTSIHFVGCGAGAVSHCAALRGRRIVMGYSNEAAEAEDVRLASWCSESMEKRALNGGIKEAGEAGRSSMKQGKRAT